MKKHLLSICLALPFFLAAQPNDPATVAKQVDSLVQVASTLISQRAFDEALPTVEAAKKLALEKFGKDQPAYASCLFQEARFYHLQNQAEEAERRYLEVISIREKTLGKDHPDYAAVLNNLGILYVSLGRYKEAENLYLEVRDIRAGTLGKDHPDYATILTSMGILYVRMNRFDEAAQAHLEAKAIREEKLGKDHRDYISTLNNLGSVYYRSGRYEEAEPLYLEVKAWREKNLGAGHIEYAWILSNLANLYSDMGRYEEAERYYQDIKAIQEKSVGREHPDYAFTLTYQGLLCKIMGRYEEAEQYLLEAKSIYEKTLGKEHPDYTACLDKLAVLYFDLGQYEAAEPLYQEIKAIREKQLGKDHPDYAKALNNLAVLYVDMDRREAAEPLYLEAKNIFGKAGKENLDYLWTLNNLAILYKDQGRFEQAETMLTEVKAAREKILGKGHPDFANTLEDLAALYKKMGKPGMALPLQQEALAIDEKTLGKQHPRYARNLNILAGLLEMLGKDDEAEPLFIEANRLQRDMLIHATRYLSARELSSYAALFANDLDGLYSFARQNAVGNAQILAALFDNILFYKGFLLTASNQIKQLALRDTATVRQYELLTAYQRRLADQYAKPIGDREEVAELVQKANDAEKDLVRKVAGFGEAIRQVTWEEVRSTLQPGEAVVEFVQYRNRNPGPTDSVLYAALILRPEAAMPDLVQLCKEKSLDSLFGAHTVRKGDYANALYSYQERGVTPIGWPQKKLFELIWQPLDSMLKGVETIYFSPSGLLHRLNLGAIPYDEETVLADRFKLVQLGSARQLVVPHEPFAANRQALLIGGVQYELDSTALAQRQVPAESMADRGQAAGALNFDPVPAQRGRAWGYLGWTKKEVAAIRSIAQAAGIDANACTGHTASEEAFKLTGRTKPSPRIIHLATHGFFFPDPNLATRGEAVSSGKLEPVFKMANQPMMRSGLILAGANFAWTTGRPAAPGMEDGILTAFEISQLDLSATELVALSACETGLGDIEGNEGVYGLQRAFKIAGAKYLIMSLWEVPDEQTKKLMTLFYEKWLGEKMAIPDAFRAAQKTMREIGFSPYQWAGFVLVE
ncbi:MAG: tetratricopeptide repeat protein [Lewinellaceae bacterium]|nr:tetratricopeptide repeat protein [Saprospiraceae bacterium]MCB9337775.1 tetratricopeptide repeat protein [Lewinellaceae bacterium]